MTTFAFSLCAGINYHKSMKNTQTLIGIQQEYIDTVNAGIARWSHRKKGGHAARISRGARHTAERKLHGLGFTDDKQIAQIIQDARDMATLERNADV
jgi:predicted Rdx family selenoprotein